jgi:hypothetical protein
MINTFFELSSNSNIANQSLFFIVDDRILGIRDFVMSFLSDSFRETERMLDNIIAEGQILQSRAYEMKLKAESQKAIGVVTSNLVTEGIS